MRVAATVILLLCASATASADLNPSSYRFGGGGASAAWEPAQGTIRSYGHNFYWGNSQIHDADTGTITGYAVAQVAPNQ